MRGSHSALFRRGQRALAGLVCALCVLALGGPAAAAGVLHVIYPRIEERPPDDYGYQVLDLALAKSGVPYTLGMSEQKMNQERARLMLEQGQISVLDSGTSPEFEARYDAVYFPLDRGLSGYRLFLIHRDRAEAFARVRTVDDLRKLNAGQGPGWADTLLLQRAGIVVKTAEFESLFRMVNAKRIDFFPLGADEIYGLRERYLVSAPALVVESRLALHYPFARLFFVRKGDQPLRDALLAGLQKAHADGSLARLLEADMRFRANLERAGLKTRAILQIDNPNLTPAFLQIPKEYFYVP